MTDACLNDLLTQLSRKLSNYPDQPRETALVLLAHLLDHPKTWIVAHPEARLTRVQADQAEALADRLLAGEPLPYLTGAQEFFGLPFSVTPSVLIPRPETELLVEQALDWLQSHPGASAALDLGTGSGCIAVSLAVHCPGLRLVASDLSAEALALARSNAKTHQVADQIDFLQADMIPTSLPQFDLICANLPYIPTGKLVEVNSLPFEPVSALDGGPDGLSLIRKCLRDAPRHIRQPGLILLETEASLGSQTLSAAQTHFPEGKITLLQDLAGKDRLVRIALEDQNGA